MTRAEIEAKIATLKKGISSALVNDKMKEGMRVQIEKFEARLAEMGADTEQEEDAERVKKPTGEKKKKVKKESAQKPASASKPAKKQEPETTKEEVPKPEPVKKDVPKPGDDKKEIKKTIADLRSCLSVALGHLNGHKATKGPRKRKKVSQVLSDGIVATMKRAIGMEMTNEKAAKIKPEQLKKVRDSFKAGLKSLRTALGGIDAENDKFIEDFEKSFNELIDKVEKKQDELKEAK